MSVRIIKDTRFEGLKALHRRLASDKRRVLVGVPKGKVEEDGTPIAMIAAVHEFGSPARGIPERSFLRAGILAHLQQLVAMNAEHIRKIANGGFTVLTALNRLGVFGAGAVQQYIVEGSFIPNAPATIKAKGSSKPLIASAMLRQSITHQISDGSEDVAL
jgi:hypothetical protein